MQKYSDLVWAGMCLKPIKPLPICKGHSGTIRYPSLGIFFLETGLFTNFSQIFTIAEHFGLLERTHV